MACYGGQLHPVVIPQQIAKAVDTKLLAPQVNAGTLQEQKDLPGQASTTDDPITRQPAETATGFLTAVANAADIAQVCEPQVSEPLLASWPC